MRIVDCPWYRLEEVDAVVVEAGIPAEVDVEVSWRVREPI